MRFESVFKTTAAIFMLSVFATPIVQASTLTFQPNNGAVFSDANPNGNPLMLATVVKPKNTGILNTAPLGTLNEAQLTEQSVIQSHVSNVNNQVYSCGTGCKADEFVPVGGGAQLHIQKYNDNTETITKLNADNSVAYSFSDTYTGTAVGGAPPPVSR